MMREVLASLFLLAIPLALIGWGIVWTLRSHYSFPQACLMLTATLLTRLLWRATIPQRLPTADDEGAVFISNHRSSVDPFFFQVVAKRPMHWMVAREYFSHPLFGWFLRQTEAIPVGRGGIDTAATKQAIRYASQGDKVGMLPEGRINMTDEFMLPARPGAAMVAMKAGVPLVPCYIDGAPYDGTAWGPLTMTARVRVKYGRPIPIPPAREGESDDQRAARFMLIALQEIAKLAGREDFEPTLAGRRWKPSKDEVDRLASIKQKQRRR